MERVLARLSLPGVVLLALGAWWVLGAERLCSLALGEKGRRFVMPLKIIGIILALAGAVILLDLIPGM